MGFSDFENLVNLDAYHDFDCKSELTETDVKVYATMVEEGDANDDYKDFLLCLLNKISSNIKSLRKRRREEEENIVGRYELEINEDSDKDLNYKAFLENLRYDEKSYVVKIEVDGLPLDLKYEGHESSDEEYDYKRKLRSARKKHKGPSNGSQSTYLSKETENLGRRKSSTKDLISNGECDYKMKLRSARKKHNGPSNGSQSTYVNKEAETLSQRKSSKKVKDENLIPDEIVEDPDYAAFLQGSKIVGDQPVYGDGHNTNDGESGPKREAQDDEWAPYVKILNHATFYKEGNSNSSVEAATDGSKNKSEFRRQLLADLRKPYDKDEYEGLLVDIEFRPKVKYHIDFRHGRERSCPKDKDGKSYLDHHSDLEEQLSQLCDDKPKRLNLLRGFFFWLEKASHSDSFHPWKDAECLAIIPVFLKPS